MRKLHTIHAPQAFAALIALAICLTGMSSAEEVELTGTYQIQIGCAETHHEEIPMLVFAGEDKFSIRGIALKLDPETMRKFHPGQKITVKGKKREAVTKKMTKAQVRKAMVKHTEHGEGLPIHGKEIGEIVSKIQIDKPEPAAARAHDHGRLQIKALEDDHEMVEVRIMAHIEVAQIEPKN